MRGVSTADKGSRDILAVFVCDTSAVPEAWWVHGIIRLGCLRIDRCSAGPMVQADRVADDF